LLKRWEEHPVFDGIGRDHELGLFQRHFILMNALYSLQSDLWSDGALLEISPLEIRLQWLSADGVKRELPAVYVSLSEYYLDWNHFNDTTVADVRALLDSFWRDYCDLDRRTEAFNILGLAIDASPQVIKRQYRQLASSYHPDRGGCPEKFIEVRRAWEILR